MYCIWLMIYDYWAEKMARFTDGNKHHDMVNESLRIEKKIQICRMSPICRPRTFVARKLDPDSDPDPSPDPPPLQWKPYNQSDLSDLTNAPITTLFSWKRKTTAGKVSSNMVDTEVARLSSRNTSFEQQFNCLICWTPNLRMIYGSCQHRLCENCLYDKVGNRRFGLERCPTCQRENAFPATRPDVPEDNIEIQLQLGVRKCPNSGCKQQMWHWELPDHLQ